MAKTRRKNLTKCLLWLFILALLIATIPVGINDWVIKAPLPGSSPSKKRLNCRMWNAFWS